MAFWVSGRDAVSGEPGRMLSDAATAEEAQEQARKQGLLPVSVEPADPHPETSLPWPRTRPPSGLLTIGIGVGLLLSCFWSAALTEVYRLIGKTDLATVVVVLLYFVVPTVVIWIGLKDFDQRRDSE